MTNKRHVQQRQTHTQHHTSLETAYPQSTSAGKTKSQSTGRKYQVLVNTAGQCQSLD